MPVLAAALAGTRDMSRKGGSDMRSDVVEGHRDRVAVAKAAGWGRLSLPSLLAGTMVAYGSFIVLLALVSGLVARFGSGHTKLSANDWRNIGTGAGIGVAVLLFLSYLFGAYVAGRMARRSGLLNGLFVFILGVLVVGAVAAVVGTQTDQGTMVHNLRNVGIPTSGREWSHVGTIAGIAALVAMVLGSLLGGLLGERWHTKLTARAADPAVGPSARREVVTGEPRDPDGDGR